ncbi:MAG: cytochrome c oxidase assembly protein [Dehalococcoidia bacterium]
MLRRFGVFFAAALAGVGPFAGPALAHGAGAAKPDLQDLLFGWELDPLFIIPMGVIAWAYAAGVNTVHRRTPRSPVPLRRIVFFYGGLAATVLAIASPIAKYDTTLFSVHMVQHMLLISVAAPLIALGAPITLALRVASPATRKRVILPILHSHVVRGLSWPVFTWAFLTGTLWITHFSPVFDAALDNEWLHRGEHVWYMSAALLFWWPAVAADPGPWRMNHLLRLLYVFMQMPQQSLLANTIYNAQRVIFPHYENLQRDWGPSPLSDQELAGVMMWVVGDMFFLVAVICLAYGWVQHEEREAKRVDRRLARERAARQAAEAEGTG